MLNLLVAWYALFWASLALSVRTNHELLVQDLILAFWSPIILLNLIVFFPHYIIKTRSERQIWPRPWWRQH